MFKFILRLLGNDLSIIVQGPITYRRFLWVAWYYRIFAPLSEVIFSHYSEKIHNSFVTKLGIRSVLNIIPMDMKDVKINKARSGSIPNNINLQILTTRAGLVAASKANVIKIRSDLLIIYPMLIILIGTLFHGKIICINYSIAPVKIMKFLPHVSDWFFYGSREAIRHMFRNDYPVTFLNTGKHAVAEIAGYYQERNYTDFMQAEEFLTLSYTTEPGFDFNRSLNIDHDALDAGVKENFVICFGPSLLLVHLGRKWNYWVPHCDRANIQDLSDAGYCAFGKFFESASHKFHKAYRYGVKNV